MTRLLYQKSLLASIEFYYLLFSIPTFDELDLQLKTWTVRQSMNGKGNCWDNAVAESFFKTMETETVYHRAFQTKAEAKLAMFEYIEVGITGKEGIRY